MVRHLDKQIKRRSVTFADPRVAHHLMALSYRTWGALGDVVHRDLCFPSRQRLRHCSRPFIHRQWARNSSSRQAPAEQYTPITVLSSGRKHLDRV